MSVIDLLPSYSSTQFHQSHDQRRHGRKSKQLVVDDAEQVHREADSHFRDVTIGDDPFDPNSGNADMRDAINAYAGSRYRPINRGLRAGGGDLSAEDAATVTQLDEAFQTASVTNHVDVQVYRVTDERAGIHDAAVGDRLVDDGFMSTTAVRPSPKTSGSVLINLTIPAGTSMLAGSEPESELILDRGTQTLVTGTRVNESGVHILDMVVQS